MSVISADYSNYIMSREELYARLPAVEKQCEICRGMFSVPFDDSYTRICPECLRRLERMLYPERED